MIGREEDWGRRGGYGVFEGEEVMGIYSLGSLFIFALLLLRFHLLSVSCLLGWTRFFAKGRSKH